MQVRHRILVEQQRATLAAQPGQEPQLPRQQHAFFAAAVAAEAHQIDHWNRFPASVGVAITERRDAGVRCKPRPRRAYATFRDCADRIVPAAPRHHRFAAVTPNDFYDLPALPVGDDQHSEAA